MVFHNPSVTWGIPDRARPRIYKARGGIRNLVLWVSMLTVVEFHRFHRFLHPNE